MHLYKFVQLYLRIWNLDFLLTVCWVVLDPLAQLVEVLDELFEVVLGEIYPRFFVLLDLLQNRFIVISNFILRFIKFLHTLLVFSQCNLYLIFGVEAIVHNLLHFLLSDFSLLEVHKCLFNFDLQLFGLMPQVHILSFRFSEILLLLIILLQKQFGLIKLGYTFLVVILQVHFERLNQVPIDQHRPIFKCVNKELYSIFQTIYG